MKKLTYLLPLHKPDYKVVNEFIDSLSSKSKLVICGVYDDKKITRKKLITHIAHDGLLTECLNMMIAKVKTDFFSIVCHDDIVKPIHEKFYTLYTEYKPDVDIYLQMITEENNVGNQIGITNHTVWAKGFSDKQAYLDNESLKRYFNYSLYGAIIRTESIKDIGLFKTNLDTIYEYEFLLRATQNDLDIYVVPKLTYTHKAREDSRTNKLRAKYNQLDINNLKNVAKKECYFKNDRPLEILETN